MKDKEYIAVVLYGFTIGLFVASAGVVVIFNDLKDAFIIGAIGTAVWIVGGLVDNSRKK
jgi:hypothetical protein